MSFKMEKTIISVKNLGKRYLLGQGGGEGYRVLRDVMANAVKDLFKKNNENVDQQEFWALKDITFDVRVGEKIGIIGWNGAGKSTLLKILSEITEPTEGEVRINGRVASLLEVGTGFHPELTGRENIFMNGAILGMRHAEIKKKFDEIVAFAEVEKFLDTPVKRYSSGMYVRLAFAVAAHLEPEILLVDEVLAVGDIQFQKKCLGKMEEISSGGRTVLFVSHNMSSVRNLCQRTILLTNGKIEKEGPSVDIINYYISKSHINESGSVKWDISDTVPGNNDLKVHSVSVVSSQGDITSEFTTDQDVTIEIKFWNFKEGEKYIVNINLKSSDDLWVFTSVNAPSANIGKDIWYEKPYCVGLYKTECRIPANLLNNGKYYVYIAIAYQKINEAIVQLEDVISFSVYDIGEMSKEYNGPWLGPIRPKLYWNTELIDRYPTGTDNSRELT